MEDSQKQQDLFDLLGAMYTAVMFLGTGNAMGVQPIVDIERTVLYRERAAGMYSTLAYGIGQVNHLFLIQQTQLSFVKTDFLDRFLILMH